MSSISISFAQNPIVTENLLTGTPQSAWDANEGGPIEGFAQEFSVNKGQTVHFKVNINSAVLVPFTVKIYRIGWYNGNGARFITDLGNSLTGKSQPAFNYQASTGKVDCNNWSVSASWTVPNNAATVSGVYIARFDCPSVGGSSIQQFVVRDDAANSPILFKTSDATWQAYNTYGGNTFYAAATPVPGFTHAIKVSYQRPIFIRGDKSGFFNSEYPMIRWLERNGYNISYATDQDMARDPSTFTPSIHKIVLSVGHDEYYSLEQRSKFENARSNGVHFAFFSGNNMYWKTRWEDSYETLVCYKEGTMGELPCGSKCDPLPNVWTGLWRDGCAPNYAPNDGCNPEGSFVGQMSWTQSTASIKVPDTYKNLRFWKNTTVASLGAGQTKTLPYGTLGNEWDPEQYMNTYPAHRIVLSNTQDNGYIHKMAIYKYSSGALIFSAGTMQWSWGLDDKHDLNIATPPAQPASADMQQATVNLFHDMGVTAGSLQAGLVTPTIGSDALAPSTTITSPTHNSTVAGSTVTVTGTSVDNGTGSVGGVEVSIDNGATWQTATGLGSWTYSFMPTGYGTITIKVRAWDDLGNVEVPGSPGTANCINILVSGPFNHSVFNSTYPQTTPAFFSGASLELGMKFQTSVAGSITGFRYYKGAGVIGTHTGHLWTSTGTLLASQTFTNETPIGWQTVTLTTPIAITPNTTYVVSYFSPAGTFTREDPFFSTAIQNGFLRGLANGEDGGNGVYIYSGSSAFPNNTSGSSNYFADVLFKATDITPPTVSSVTPLNNATGVVLNIHPTATFNEAIDPASVSTSSVILTAPGNVVVPSTVSVSGSVITITPNADLSVLTTYTIKLKGGLTEPLIKDISDNALAADFTWSFTTGGASAPVVTLHPVSQNTCANSSISFSSAANGIPTPTVKWQVSTNGGGAWSDIPGATSSTYTFTAVFADNNNQYRAVWTNVQGFANSNPATLTVLATISGNVIPVNANICPGQPLQLQLTSATGPSPYTLQINGTTYSGTTVYSGITVGQIFRAVGPDENIIGSSETPDVESQGDNNSVELGVRFKANKAGYIKGIRFYKGALNTGTHTGTLWTEAGAVLATATFTNETATGWQTVIFSTPVSITANTNYVASYFAPNGGYATTGSYFTTDHFNGSSLTGTQDTPTEPNGLYEYNNVSIFPTSNGGDPNYWVDVVYAPFLTTTTTFNLTNITANNGCAVSGSPLSSFTITVNATVNAGTVSGQSPLCLTSSTTYTTDGHPGGSWSSSNPAVATVNPTTGVVTGVSVGSANIIYTVTGCDGTKTAQKTVNVPANVNAGTVTPGTSPLCIGATTTYTSNGDAGGTWSSDNVLVATVNPTTGLVTAVGAGTTNIVYTVTGCPAPASASASITVNPNANPGTVAGSSPLCIGATITFTTNGTSGGTWSSTNPAVASVHPTSGLVTTLAAGTTNITYTVNVGCNAPQSAFSTLVVNPNATAGTVSGVSPLCIGSTSTYTSNGDAGGSWSSTNPSVASVNPTSGLVTALAPGTTNITYTINTGCFSPVSSFKTLTVSPNVNAGTVSGTTPLCIGATATYTSNGDAGGSWSSTNTGIATVNPSSGLVTAVASGTTDITYTVNGCGGPVSSFKTLTVSPNANSGTVSGTLPLCIGATATFSSNGNAGGSWSSTNPAAATVNASSGLVTAIAPGTTNITYTVSTGCNNPVSSFVTLTVPAAMTGVIAAVNANICPGAPLLLQLNSANGPSPYALTINGSPYTNISVGVPFRAVGPKETIWTVSDLPETADQPDDNSVELGVRFQANKAGQVKGIRFYKGSTANGGTHVGSLWSQSGTLLAQATFTNETASGWQEVIFSTPVDVLANTTYIASYFAPLGHYSRDGSYFSSPHSNGISLTGLQNTGSDPNGLYLYTSTPAFPTNNPGDPNYWVDVVYMPFITTTTTFNLTSIAANNAANNGCTATGSPISSTTITVSAIVNAGTVSGLSPLCIGATATYTTNGHVGGSWSSTNPSVATVNPTTGLVTAIGPGSSDITYTITGCDGTKTAFQPVTVLPNANPGTISGPASLCSGTASFTTNGEAGGTWSSTNTAVATVNASSGLVTVVAPGTTNIRYTVNVGCNSPLFASKTLTVGCNSIVNLKLFLEGYYLGGGEMQPVLLNQGVGVSATQTDNITVELHDATTFATVASTTGMLNTDGTVSLTYPSLSGSYYVAVIHRNTIQTWSANPITVGAVPVTYDFTTAANKAFGDNMKQLGGVWVFFTGDMNQDEFIDALDYPLFDNDNFNGVNGVYIATDMNGDGFVDALDYPVFDNNNFIGVQSIHP